MSDLALNNSLRPVPLADVTNKQGQKSSGLDVNVDQSSEYSCTNHSLSYFPSCAPALPPSFTFSGCSVNVFTGPIMTSGTLQSSSTSFGLSQADIDNFSKFISLALVSLFHPHTHTHTP